MYYSIRFDETDKDQWFLDAPRDQTGTQLDPRWFTAGEPVQAPAGLTVPVNEPGHPLDVSFASFDMIVTSRRVADVIEQIAPEDIQRIPVTVESTDGHFEILNVVATVDCIDGERTIGDVWPQAGPRPEKAGQWRMIVELRLDPGRVTSHHIFRVRGWEIAVVVSARLRDELERIRATGLVYDKVS